MRLAIAARRVKGLSGAVRLILAEAAAATAAGWEVDIFAEKIDGAAVRAVGAVPHPMIRWPWGSWLKRRFFAELASRMVRSANIVHGHGDIFDQDILSLHNCVHAAHEALTGLPLPESDAGGRFHALQLSGRHFQILIANSQIMKDDVIRRFQVPKEMIEVVYPGFDQRRFSFTDRARLGANLRAELGLSSEALLFGLVSSGDFEKRGLPSFLRAFALISRKIPGVHALIVGKESRPGRYLHLASQLDIADRVFFRQPQVDVERFYHALNVYVHAAPWEEFGMTILEALACGVPVIAGARAGAAELLAGEARVFVLDELSPDALAAAMEQLACQPDLRARLAALAPTFASTHTLETYGHAVVALHERLAIKSLPPTSPH